MREEIADCVRFHDSRLCTVLSVLSRILDGVSVLDPQPVRPLYYFEFQGSRGR
jgi:hypothetical protein